MAALRRQPGPAQRRGPLYAAGLLALLAVIALALSAARPEVLWRLLSHASPWWLAAALAAKLLTPLAAAAVLQRALGMLGHPMRLRALWLTAQVAIVVSMAAPAGGVAMGAFLLYALRRRGVSGATAALTVALNALAYSTAFIIIAGLGLGYLMTHGELQVRQIREVALLALALVLGGVALWGLQRDRADLTRRALAAQRWLAGRRRRGWGEERLRGFLDELYRGKALLADHPGGFVQMLGAQLGAFLLDALTLAWALRALGADPQFSVVLIAHVLSLFIGSLTPLPGGGGSCEATLVLALGRLGTGIEAALGATLLYRALTFWLPLLLSLAVAPHLLRPPAQAPLGDQGGA